MSTTVTPLSPSEAQARLQKGNAVLVDVREVGEHMREHIPDSRLYPLSEFNAEEVIAKLLKETKSTTGSGSGSGNGQPSEFIVYCAGGVRSAQACTKITSALASKSASIAPIEAEWRRRQCQLFEITGGFTAWQAAGGAVEVNTKAPLPIMRQVQIIAGSLVAAGTLLGIYVNPRFLAIPLFVGSGLVFAGVSGFCGMAVLLHQLPYNKVARMDPCKCA